MIKHAPADLLLREPTILDGCKVLNMRKEFLTTHCKFNGTCNLDLYETYIDWLAHTINQSHHSTIGDNTSCSKITYLAFDKTIDSLIGSVEIVFYHSLETMRQHAHIIVCIRPSCRRKSYGKPLLKKAIQECNSFGIRRNNVTFERNSKASNDTMNKIMDF